jgi:hypothetical protein
MVDGAIDAVDKPRGDDGVEILGAPVVLGCKRCLGQKGASRHCRRGFRSRQSTDLPGCQPPPRDPCALSSSRVSADPQMPVRRILALTTMARAMAGSADLST